MNITNKTSRPLRVRLPGGKTLHLGPNQTAPVTPSALKHPPVIKLIEAGQITTSDELAKSAGKTAEHAISAHGVQPHVTSAARQSGDR